MSVKITLLLLFVGYTAAQLLGSLGGRLLGSPLGIIDTLLESLGTILFQLQDSPTIGLVKSIVNFLLTTIFRSLEALPYLPLLPIILRNIVDDQIRHMSYVSQRGFNSSYDYVVIGAGSGGAVMASRLSEDPSVSVLLLEAGSSENFISDVPEICLLLQKTPLDWGYESTPQKKSCRGLDNQRLPLARGKVMGGCSTLNAMIYVRGNSRDYDTWSANGATNWSWKDVFPYFIKSEDNQDQDYLANGYHGKGGPLAVTSAYVPRWSTNAFQEAGTYLGYPTGDVNGKSQSHFTLTQRTIRDGKRCSVANAYLETLAANRPNLKVLIRSHVTRIVFDNTKRATGVQFEINSVKHTVNVRKEVILSAGAINSPQILMLSGVGPADHLRKMGIPIVADLPVGNNLQDHYSTAISFTAEERIGIDLLFELRPKNILEYELYRKNTLTNNYGEATAFLSTKYVDPKLDFPDTQLIFIPATAATDSGRFSRRIQGMAIDDFEQFFRPYIGRHTISIYPIVLRPYSRGWIRLNSTNPYDNPIIEPNIFGDNRDLDILVEGMKFVLNISKTVKPFRRYDIRPFQTKFPGCEGLALYSDEYLRCYAQTYTTLFWHPVGTCKMGNTSDPTTVVDPQLRVKGVKGLRVVDASVMPTIVSGNTNAPTVMIAEKVSDMIKGRRLKPFLPPMSQQFVNQLPSSLQYEKLD